MLPEDCSPSQRARPFAHLDALVAEGCCGLLAQRVVYEEDNESILHRQQVLAEFLGLLQVSICKGLLGTLFLRERSRQYFMLVADMQ